MGNGNSRSAAGRIFRISRTLTLVGTLVISLAVNATLFVGGVIYDVVDTFVESVTGLQTASALQRQALSKLQGQNRQLRAQVQTVRTANRQLRGQVQTVRSANRQLQREVRTTVEQTRKRLQRSAVRSVATLPGRALPIAGTAVSVAITGLLIKDLPDYVRTSSWSHSCPGSRTSLLGARASSPRQARMSGATSPVRGQGCPRSQEDCDPGKPPGPGCALYVIRKIFVTQ